MNPFSPQLYPQEFFTIQLSDLRPTKSTPWLSFVPQLLNTPEEYLCQLEASTATEIGLSWIAYLRLIQKLTSVNPEIMNGPPFLSHFCCLAT